MGLRRSATDFKEVVYQWLLEEDQDNLNRLFRLADDIRKEHLGNEVHLRGLVEFSNFCVRNCTYCGIRKGNTGIPRYRMSEEEILDCAALAYSLEYGTVVLQSGEDDKMPADWLAGVIGRIKRTFPLAVTLSLGERPIEDYRIWRDAGADRYLMKFETSDPGLYRRIHPAGRYGEPGRIELLKALRGMGYEIGGGIMVGIPGQTYKSLVRDMEIFAELDLDMIGIGPYIPHPDTPLGREYFWRTDRIPDQAPNTDQMTCRVVALTRILCPDANIPATTALATVDPCGFEDGLRAGANVIMPNLTPLEYRALYQIYPNTLYQSPEDTQRQVAKAIIACDRWPGRGRGDRIRRRIPRYAYA